MWWPWASVVASRLGWTQSSPFHAFSLRALGSRLAVSVGVADLLSSTILNKGRSLEAAGLTTMKTQKFAALIIRIVMGFLEQLLQIILKMATHVASM